MVHRGLVLASSAAVQPCEDRVYLHSKTTPGMALATQGRADHLSPRKWGQVLGGIEGCSSSCQAAGKSRVASGCPGGSAVWLQEAGRGCTWGTLALGRGQAGHRLQAARWLEDLCFPSQSGKGP